MTDSARRIPVAGMGDLVRGGLSRIAFGGAIMVLGGITQAMVARKYGPTGYGTFTLGYVIAVFLGSTLDLGIGGILPARVRLTAGGDSAVYLRGALLTVACAGMAFLALGALPLTYLWESYGYTPVMVVLLCVGGIVSSVVYVVSIYREAQLSITRAMVPLVIAALLQLAFTLVGPGSLAVEWFVVCFVIGGSASALLTASIVRPRKARIDTSSRQELFRDGTWATRQMLPVSWPLLIVGIAAFVQVWMDKPVLGSLLTRELLGVYTALVLMIRVVRFLPQCLTALLTSLYGRLDSDAPAFRATAHTDLVIATVYFGVAAVVSAAILDRALPLAFGMEFMLPENSGIPLLLSAYLVICPWLTQSTNWLNALGRTRTNMVMSLINAALQTAGILVFVPIWGLAGAVAAILVGNCMDAAIRAHLCRRILEPRTVAAYCSCAGLVVVCIVLSLRAGAFVIIGVPLVVGVGLAWLAPRRRSDRRA
jgi:O-antigen/teichoic acid export membrane protein